MHTFFPSKGLIVGMATIMCIYEQLKQGHHVSTLNVVVATFMEASKLGLYEK